MNLYFVKSKEMLMDQGPDYYDPPEYYYAAELVIAKTRAQAIYMVNKKDNKGKTFPMRDLFPCKCKKLTSLLNEDIARIVSDESDYQHFWELT